MGRTGGGRDLKRRVGACWALSQGETWAPPQVSSCLRGKTQGKVCSIFCFRRRCACLAFPIPTPPPPPPPCFAVSVFLSDLRKIKFILLIKIMTLSLVLFSSVSTYSLCWVYLKPMGLVTRMRMKRDRTIPQAQQSQLYKPSGLARERPYRRDGIVGTCVI